MHFFNMCLFWRLSDHWMFCLFEKVNHARTDQYRLPKKVSKPDELGLTLGQQITDLGVVSCQKSTSGCMGPEI